LQQLEAIFVGQAKIEHHHVEFGDLEHRPRFRSRIDVFNGQALSGEASDDATGDQLIVFANQYVHVSSMSKNAIQATED
jgi:hypothetical protein